ncbi:hypothetical protein BKA66DRAFT_565202 [Pyrenochaeta sp. MPI-SDFR-AT-0127]|nr:hypothetical protein BKA66DRAFT_565202 [Pyrenochaeta sp. MPI-SDFR-AT-0127]
MATPIELGRAVLCAPTTNLELWLTTLITVSPQRGRIDIRQLKSSQILDLMSTGHVWTCRGHVMHAELHLMFREEPLPHTQLRDLAESIVQGPVWGQLMLQPSIPTDIALEPGIIRLNIKYNDNNNNTRPQEEHRRRRVCMEMPTTDVQPPLGVPIIALETIRFTIEIVETRQRTKTAHKRLRVEGEADGHLLSVTNSVVPNAANILDAPRHESGCPVTTPIERKPMRSASRSNRGKNSSPPLLSVRHRGTRRQPVISTDLRPNSGVTVVANNYLEVEDIVDAALRFSVSGSSNNKSVNGLKVKASTFQAGLADIAPALWRPDYLIAVSQRAYLLPTISRSLSQSAGMKATSISLKYKLHMLSKLSNNYIGDGSHQEDLIVEHIDGKGVLPIAGELWKLLQKSLPSKPRWPLLAFVATGACASPDSSSDDMLEEVEQRIQYPYTSTLGANVVLGSMESDDEHLLDDGSPSSVRLDADISMQHVSTNSTCKDDSRITKDDLLFDF